MSLSPKQIKIAARINARVVELMDAGCDDMTIMNRMEELVPEFDRLMDTVGDGEIDALCEGFEGFSFYVEKLQQASWAASSGKLKVR